MNHLLYRWSTAGQLASVLLIALFYTTLSRSLRRAELSWWARGWWSNFAALAVTVSYWFLVPTPIVNPLIRATYVSGKMLYAVLLVQGARAMTRPGSQWLSQRALTYTFLATLVVGAIGFTNINELGVGVQGALGVIFLWTASYIVASTGRSMGWLAAGFFLRGAFGVVEALAYGMNLLGEGVLSAEMTHTTQLFLGAHSSLDLGAEWLIALGGVLAITQRAQHELETANRDLLAVQAQLRNLADRDPLTGLANRRALPETFRGVYSTGATFVFFDIDGFKRINDTFGHAVGDEALARFAGELRTSFRPSDSIVRYAGDEFVVIAPSMTVDMVKQRIGAMRERLTRQDDNGVAVAFSAGIAEMLPSGDAEATLRAADEAMYAAKALRA